MYSVLCVDDNALVLKTLGKVFDKDKFSVDLASTGEEAVKMLSQKNYDVVVSDLNLPGINGLDVLREAKRLNPLVSAILLTGEASEQSLSKSREIGISDYMVKPIDVKEFLCGIDECIKRYEYRKRTKDVESKFWREKGGG